MRIQLFRFVLFLTIISSSASCLTAPPPNNNVCNNEQGSFEFATTSETYQMVIKENTFFVISDGVEEEATLISGSWQPNDDINEKFTITAGFDGDLTVGTKNYTNDQLGLDDYFVFVYTNSTSAEIIEFHALNLNLTISEANRCQTVSALFCPVKGTFSGDFYKLEINNKTGEEKKDTIQANGSFCLYDRIL